jgi:hypothetical protein
MTLAPIQNIDCVTVRDFYIRKESGQAIRRKQSRSQVQYSNEIFQLRKDLQARKFSTNEFLFLIAAKYNINIYESFQCEELSAEPGEESLLDVSKYSYLIKVSTI